MDHEALANGSQDLMSEQGHSQPQEGLFPIALIVLQHRWTILLTTVGFLVVGFAYIMKATPIYTSASRLYVEQSGPKIINEYEGVMTQSHNYLYTQSELIRSTPIISDAVNDTRIGHLETFAGIDNLVGYVKRKLKVAVGRKDDIITVSFDSPYPQEAAQLVNAMVDSYVRYHSARQRSTVSEVLRILEKEKVRRDEELSGKFAELLAFTRENGVVSFDDNGGNIVLERLTRLSSALTETQLAALNAKADFEAAKRMANEPAKIRQFAGAAAGAGVHVSGSDRETQLRAELRRVEMDLENAKYHGTEDHPSIKAIRSEIHRINKELNEQTKEFADAYIEVMQLRWLAAKQREDELMTSFDSQHQAAQELGVKAAQYAMLQSELNRTERICEILDDRIKELNVTEDTGALNISVLEVARPARSPSEPQKRRVMATALALGLVFGTCLAFLRDWMDYRLRSCEEISSVLHIPVLGVIPAISEGQRSTITRGREIWLKLKSIFADISRTAYSRTVPGEPKGKAKPGAQPIMAQVRAYRALRATGTKAQPVAVGASSPNKDETTTEEQALVEFGQVVHFKPRSIAAEAYRTLRTSIFFGVPKGGAKTILVTSPAPGDGKTTLVSNLAIATAQAGQGTLVIDADLRKPRQHRIFEIDHEPGLTNVLAGTVRLDEAIQPGPVTGLDLLSCGSQVPNPSEMLNSDVFAQMLKDLPKCYDRVIIDSPPVLPVTDSQIIAASCDVTLLVLRADKSTRRLSQQARDSLVSVGGHLLGAVVNGVKHKHGRYSYYNYSGYGYDSGYDYGDYYDDDISAESRDQDEANVHVHV